MKKNVFVLCTSPALQVDYRITVQMLEIYNEALRDLLAEGGRSAPHLEILNTQASGCNVPGAMQVRGGCWVPKWHMHDYNT